MARGEYLGLHLTIGLSLSLLMLALFAAIAGRVIWGEGVPAIDNSVGLRLREAREASPAVKAALFDLTWLGSIKVIAPLAVFITLLLVIRRRFMLASVWALALTVGGLLDGLLKYWFSRPRPPFCDAVVPETTSSFPSGHSMGSLICYGLIAYLLILTLPRRMLRITAVVFLVLLIAAIGFSRMYLGAHYLSDVMGGYCLGAFWLCVCICVVETVRRHTGPKR